MDLTGIPAIGVAFNYLGGSAGTVGAVVSGPNYCQRTPPLA